MRFPSILLVSIFSLTAVAAEETKPVFQDAPPPPVIESAADEDLEPQVTIVKKKDMVIEEYRSHGKLYKIKVIPKSGPAYYLVDENGDGQFTRQDGPDGANMLPPRWVIFKF